MLTRSGEVQTFRDVQKVISFSNCLFEKFGSESPVSGLKNVFGKAKALVGVGHGGLLGALRSGLVCDWSWKGLNRIPCEFALAQHERIDLIVFNASKCN